MTSRFCYHVELLTILTAISLAGCGADESLVQRPANPDTVAVADTGAAEIAAPEDTGKPDTPDTSVPDTAGQCPGGAGCPCQADKECPGAACLPTEQGRKCAAPCPANGICQGGYACVSVTASDAKTYKLCARKYARLCDPCTVSTSCKTPAEPISHCVSVASDKGESGFYCASECQTQSDCPAGYLCNTVQVVEGGQPGKHCVPSDSKCVCSKLAQTEDLKTTCFVSAKNASGVQIGVCNGKRLCTADGLGACSAAKPTVETCNGKDDNCDGKTDEGVNCDDNNLCTVDSCGGGQGCVHPSVGKGCDDGNPCTADGCDPLTGCTHAPNADPCNDNDACTSGDVCTKGKCVGAVLDCDDKNPCTDQTCKSTSGCLVVNNVDPCSDGNACTTADKCKDGKCLGGVAPVCDDKNPCTLDGCDMAKGCTTSDDNGATCDDGNACTGPDVCLAAACTGTTVSCDDGNSCTADSCAKTSGCAHAVTPKAPCEDGNACTIGDVCSAVAPAACLAGAATNCDDASPCTTDSCNTKTGACVHTPMADSTPCDDGTICTLADVCAAGKCDGTPLPCDDKNACTEDFCDSKLGCTSKALTGTACDDKQECTGDGTCKAGLCTGGQALSDGTPCNAGAGTCTLGKCK